MFSDQDLKQIEAKGISLEEIEYQLERFRSGYPYANIIEPASVQKGIFTFEKGERDELIAYFSKSKEKVTITRFVPASGAATRMFKNLFEMKDALLGLSLEEQNQFVKDNAVAHKFFKELPLYPFYSDLNLDGSEKPLEILERILIKPGLDYGSKPKGMLKFHGSSQGSRTAFEEHFHEAYRLASGQKVISLHFTVSREHLEGFKALEKAIKPLLEKKYEVSFAITYSFQKSETDTLAVDMENLPVRTASGELLFRPGGHGALLENLNDINGDVIFINNIDNVSPDSNSMLRTEHKSVLGGLLLLSRNEVFELIEGLNNKEERESYVKKAFVWLKERACVEIPEKIENATLNEIAEWQLSKLDRPLRVCGMVKNEGEPGGGPFFIKNGAGDVSLQIVEASQIDASNAFSMEKLKLSSHFNPVDIVCSTRRYDGSKFDLKEFIDLDAGFISEKSVQGKALKALELPGLWNGSMAEWLTMFVEVPAETFTPVKTVFDLLRPEHRPRV